MADEPAKGSRKKADAPPEYSFRLKADWFDEGVEPTGSFMAGGDSVELTGSEVFKTEDGQIAAGLRELPFLESAD